MIAFRKAQRLVVESAPVLGSERVALALAVDRITTRSIIAPMALPRFTASSMDGYALLSRVTRGASRANPVRLLLARRRILAGARPGGRVPAGSAVRIMTGAPLPLGADAVLPEEEAQVRRGTLLVTSRVRAGANVRKAGEDIQKGGTALPAGSRVHAGSTALLSALGVGWIDARRPPRVAIVVTGNEVRRPRAGRLPGSSVWDSHAAFLRAALREFHLEPVLVDYVPDRAPPIRRGLARALKGADLVIVTGGISVGDRDLVRPILAELKVRRVFWGVAQQPGKPLYFGRRGGVLVFGLPGNPASTIVCYCEYVRPAIRRLLGETRCLPEEFVARAAPPLHPAADRTRLLRGRLIRRAGIARVVVTARQASHLLRPFSESDCLVVVPPASKGPARDRSRVRVHPLPWRTS